jgi:hypothetical protein
MQADFRSESVTLTLDGAEFGFLVRCVNDRIHSLPEDDIEARLGLSYDARLLLDAILAAESQARTDGRHWLPPQPPQ